MSQSGSIFTSKPAATQHPAHSTSATTTSPFNDVASLTFHQLDQAEVLRQVNHPSAGASVLFTGSTRDNFKGKKVSRLEYEAYTSLAIKTLHQILLRARSQTWPPPSKLPSAATDPTKEPETEIDPQEEITRIIIHHRLGSVPISESSILVAVSSPHRRKAFQVAEWCLEQVKKEVQIWKKEFYLREGEEEKERGKEEEEKGVIGLVKGLVANSIAGGNGDEKEKEKQHSSWKSNFDP